MSRTLRSAISIAQSLPGPSRPLARPALAPVVPLGSRSFFNIPLPQSWRRSAKKTETEKTETAVPEPVTSPNDAGLFSDSVERAAKVQKKVWKEHAYKSAFHKMSHRKLNDISRQVAGLPVDEALLQLKFGAKRAGQTWIKSTLALASDHAEDKGLLREKLVVAETWVSKGRKVVRVDIKGRGRMGRKHHQSARIHFVLREGKTEQEKYAAQLKKAVHKVRSAGVVREDAPIRRKMTSGWAW